MRRKVLLIVLAMMLVIAMIPSMAFADDAADAAGHKVELKLIDSTRSFNNDNIYVRMDFKYKSGNEKAKSAMVYLEYDATVLTPVFALSDPKKGQGATSYITGLGFNKLTEGLADNEYSPGESNESEVVLYEKIANNKGYMCWKWSDLRGMNVRKPLSSSTRLSSVYFKVDKTKYGNIDAFVNAVNATNQKIVNVMANDTVANASGVELNASCTAQISATTSASENVNYFYGASNSMLKRKADLPASNFSVTAQSFMMGDVDLNSKINIADVQLLFAYVMKDAGVTLADISLGKITPDDSVNIADVQLLFAYVMGDVASL